MTQTLLFGTPADFATAPAPAPTPIVPQAINIEYQHAVAEQRDLEIRGAKLERAIRRAQRMMVAADAATGVHDRGAIVAQYLTALVGAWKLAARLAGEWVGAHRAHQRLAVAAVNTYCRPDEDTVYQSNYSLRRSSGDPVRTWSPQQGDGVDSIPTDRRAAEMAHAVCRDLAALYQRQQALTDSLRQSTDLAIVHYQRPTTAALRNQRYTRELVENCCKHDSDGKPIYHRPAAGWYPQGGREALAVLKYWSRYRADKAADGGVPSTNRVLGIAEPPTNDINFALTSRHTVYPSLVRKGAVPAVTRALATGRVYARPYTGRLEDIVTPESLAIRANRPRRYGPWQWASIGPCVGTPAADPAYTIRPNTEGGNLLRLSRKGDPVGGRWLRETLATAPPEEIARTRRIGYSNNALPGPRFVVTGRPSVWRVIHGVTVYRLPAVWRESASQEYYVGGVYKRTGARSVIGNVLVWRWTTRDAGDVVPASVYHWGESPLTTVRHEPTSTYDTITRDVVRERTPTDDEVAAQLFVRLAPPSERERLQRLSETASREQAAKYRRLQRANMLRALRAIPSMHREDSYSAGNCRPGTADFLTATGLTNRGGEITGRELATRWRAAEYTDESLFARAIAQAAARHQVAVKV